MPSLYYIPAGSAETNHAFSSYDERTLGSQMKPTLKDIAESTGLSVSTVSRVLRGKAKRNSANVASIIEAAKHLNYPIYNDEDLLVSDDDNLFIALIASTDIGEFYSSFFTGFSMASQQAEASISLIHVIPSVDRVVDLLHDLSAKRFDAAILFLPMLFEQDYQAILEEAPESITVISAATVFNPVIDTVSFDSYRGGHLVGKHFHERGYQAIGVVHGNTNRNESLLRKSGLTDYIEHHSDMDLIWQYEGDYSFESGQDAYDSFAQLKQKPRAIFLINDNMCFGFMEQARRDGVRIPEDVALVGYDDLPICSHHYPSLSSVHTDYTQLGATAINMIEQKISNNDIEHQGLVSMVPVSLSIRESS